MESLTTKKVFISYSWSNEEHKERVLELAKALIGSGVEVILDRWHLKVGQDKYSFMEQMVNDDTIDRVLIISDKMYAEKANERRGGVGTETQIITPSLYQETAESRFIPIVFERNEQTGEEYLPAYASSRMYFDFSDEMSYQEGFEKLLREIFDKPDLRKPKLGKIPSFLFDEPIETFEVERKANLVELALDKNDQRLLFAMKDYFDVFIDDFEKLKVELRDDESPDEATVRVLGNSLQIRKSFIKVIEVIVQSKDQEAKIEFLIEFFSDLNNRIYELEIQESDLGPEALRFLLIELFLIANATFVKFRRWDMVSNLVNHMYFIDRRDAYFSYVDFRHPTKYMFDGKIEREKKKVSLPADLIKERATRNEFQNILEVDLLLYYISNINPRVIKNRISGWFPITYIYLQREKSRFIFVEKLKSQNSLKAILEVFGVSEDEIKEKIKDIKSSQGYNKSWESIPGFENFIKPEQIGGDF